MRIFVTGASGRNGSAVVPDLLTAEHQVLGLARCNAAAGRPPPSAPRSVAHSLLPHRR
jgi:uncharacterized protein YbjT (DUF2867 family)